MRALKNYNSYRVPGGFTILELSIVLVITGLLSITWRALATFAISYSSRDFKRMNPVFSKNLLHKETGHMKLAHRMRAFTLIEISVVLVILGLLIGGVVAGRVLLRQSEVSSIMVDAQKYKDAIITFQQKYSSLPGDMANATSYWGIAAGTLGNDATCYAAGSATSVATCSGNGDGQINYSSTYANESLRVWQHLANAKMITGAFTGITGAAHVVGTNSPGSRIGAAGFGISYRVAASGDPNLFDGQYGHVMYFGANYTSAPPYTGAISGPEAEGLDTKYDDGKPALGTIRTWKNGGYSTTCASSTAATATYSTSSTSNLCSLVIITGF